MSYLNGGQAARGEPIKPDYYSALINCTSVYDYLLSGNQQLLPKLVEYMPVLLGSRLGSDGWVGRLALRREDCRPVWPTQPNRNWDCGVSKGNEAKDFTNPDVHVQVKRRKMTGSQRYQNGGLKVISGNSFRLNNPLRVIHGCLAELGIVTDNIPEPTVQPYSSGHLDDLSGRLLAHMFS